MQQGKLCIRNAFQDLELKMKGKLDISIMLQIALRKDVRVIFNSAANRLMAFADSIVYLMRSRTPGCSEVELSERFVNNLGTLRHDFDR